MPGRRRWQLKRDACKVPSVRLRILRASNHLSEIIQVIGQATVSPECAQIKYLPLVPEISMDDRNPVVSSMIPMSPDPAIIPFELMAFGSVKHPPGSRPTFVSTPSRHMKAGDLN